MNIATLPSKPTGIPRTSLRARIAAAFAITAVGGLIALGAAAPASAADGVQVTATPTTITVGATTTITVTGLGGLQKAGFGLGDNSSGTFTENKGTSYEAPVTGGKATATFLAAKAGTATIAVGDGETVLGTVQVTVNGNAPAVVAVKASPDSIATGATTTITVTGSAAWHRRPSAWATRPPARSPRTAAPPTRRR